MRCLLFALTLALSVAASAQTTSRDGNWWRSQPEARKAGYVVGLFDGILLGNNFTVWDLIPKAKNPPPNTYDAYTQARGSFDRFTEKYMTKVTSGQVVDGLDSFYSDYRNRSIHIETGAWIVLQTIAGEPPSEEVLNNWRRNAK